MQLTLCDEFDLFTLSRFIALLERPFKAPTARELLRRPVRGSIARAPAEPAPAPATAPVLCLEDFEEDPERWDGLG